MLRMTEWKKPLIWIGMSLPPVLGPVVNLLFAQFQSMISFEVSSKIVCTTKYISALTDIFFKSESIWPRTGKKWTTGIAVFRRWGIVFPGNPSNSWLFFPGARHVIFSSGRFGCCMDFDRMSLEKVFVAKGLTTVRNGANMISATKMRYIMVSGKSFFLEKTLESTMWDSKFHTDLKALGHPSMSHTQSRPTSPPRLRFRGRSSSPAASSSAASISLSVWTFKWVLRPFWEAKTRPSHSA